MTPDRIDPEIRKIVQETLGYLNLSSGASDTGFLKNLNELFQRIDARPVCRSVAATLRAVLEELRGQGDAFRQVDQAEAVLRLVFDEALPAYQQYHSDLFFHQTDEQLFQPLFVGRVFEAVLQQGGPWDESQRIVAGALGQLNDYLGHRPVAVLQTGQKIQPYAHEYIRPIPLYIRGVGVGSGRYAELIGRALEILRSVDPAMLFQAWFDPELLDELAVDPRAYDFDHPVNKRPNYLFGQWDLGRLDNSGRCRRFVLQQVALDEILARVENRGRLPRKEVLYEAAAVLAGTMLMGSGVSGNGPDAHDSTSTLATLVQHIAAYRDAFYERLLAGLSGKHAQRLQAETTKLRQPFGGARQDFNQRLSRRRARQLQHVHLARLFARMGYTDAAVRQVGLVPVASARMKCDIACRLSSAGLDLRNGRLEAAAERLPEIEALLHRAVECGALVDPWNILGFGAQYSLFPAPENSVHDHRVDELIELAGAIFDLYVQLRKEAAAAGNQRLQTALAEGLQGFAGWWDKFASTEVSTVQGISGAETSQSADHVATALAAWHRAATAAGDVAFWRGHAEKFRSPKAYALVVEALLQQRDPVASMALLVQWLSQSDHIPLAEENYSFYELALQWMEDLWGEASDGAENDGRHDRWSLCRKFLDYIEANAEEMWEVPTFAMADETADRSREAEEEDDSENPYSAAYESVTYHDSTDDGFEGEIFEGGEPASDFELVFEAERIIVRLAFLTTLAKLWCLSAVASVRADGSEEVDHGQRDDVLAGWLRQVAANRRQLSALLDSVCRYRIPPPRGTHETLVEYDRRRAIKETLTEQIIAACVENDDAGRLIRAAMEECPAADDSAAQRQSEWEEPVGEVLSGLLRRDADAVERCWHNLIYTLSDQPLLYVALARGGNPHRIVESRGVQRVLQRLLAYLPRLGLLRHTAELIETIQDMEFDHPVGRGAITEFDRMFEIGCKAIIDCLVVSSEDWAAADSDDPDIPADAELIDCLEGTTEALLRSWLAHSRSVRLSVLETINEPHRWKEAKDFVQRYGGDLFTQRFMGYANLRAILHEGVDVWLQSLEEEPELEDLRLMHELDGRVPRDKAVRHLALILEAVLDNYAEYVDYNSTTTQSDRGEMLYTLLDFLRLRSEYDRVAWNLLPVALAHEVLTRRGRDEAAEFWRQGVDQRTSSIAGKLLQKLGRLNRKHGMRLASISGRIEERFVRRLAVDRIQALVRPAIDQLRGGIATTAFERLEEEVARFTEELSGAGFDLPPWLEALEVEIDRVLLPRAEDNEEALDPQLPIPQVRLSAEEARRQIAAMDE